MKRSILGWFYVTVQFVMLLVSIPKVGALFHAYDSEAFGPLFLGLDLRSWLVGIAIDATAALTSWAAMTKYEATRRRRDLLAPALIILFCSCISIIANYEDAAAHMPAQYAHIALFAVSALLLNPLIISSPPFIVFLLIVLVPSVMAEPRIKSAAQLALEAESATARIDAEARIRMAKAHANAQVRHAQLRGLRTAAAALAGADESADGGADGGADAGVGEGVGEGVGDAGDEPPDDRGPHGPSGGGPRARHGAHEGADGNREWALIASGERRALRNDLRSDTPLHKRVKAAGGVLTVNDLEDALGVSDSRAREILLGVPTSVRIGTHKNARIEAPVDDVLAYLSAHKSAVMNRHAVRLDAALHPRRNPRRNPRSNAHNTAGTMRTFPRGPVSTAVSSPVSTATRDTTRGPLRTPALGSARVASAPVSAVERGVERGQVLAFRPQSDAQNGEDMVRA